MLIKILYKPCQPLVFSFGQGLYNILKGSQTSTFKPSFSCFTSFFYEVKKLTKTKDALKFIVLTQFYEIKQLLKFLIYKENRLASRKRDLFQILKGVSLLRPMPDALKGQRETEKRKFFV